MEENDVFDNSLDNDNDNSSAGFMEEYEGLEEFEEASEEYDSGNESESGSDDSNDFVGIDYSKLQASVRDAQIVNNLDSDLNDLPVSDVILLIIALFLGILIVGGKRR